MKNKILLFIGLLILPFLVEASGMYQDIEILENGDLYIKEAIAIDGEYNGFNLKLSQMTEDDILVSGKIENLDFESKRGD